MTTPADERSSAAATPATTEVDLLAPAERMCWSAAERASWAASDPGLVLYMFGPRARKRLGAWSALERESLGAALSTYRSPGVCVEEWGLLALRVAGQARTGAQCRAEFVLRGCAVLSSLGRDLQELRGEAQAARLDMQQRWSEQDQDLNSTYEAPPEHEQHQPVVVVVADDDDDDDVRSSSSSAASRERARPERRRRIHSKASSSSSSLSTGPLSSSSSPPPSSPKHLFLDVRQRVIRNLLDPCLIMLSAPELRRANSHALEQRLKHMDSRAGELMKNLRKTFGFDIEDADDEFLNTFADDSMAAIPIGMSKSEFKALRAMPMDEQKAKIARHFLQAEALLEMFEAQYQVLLARANDTDDNDDDEDAVPRWWDESGESDDDANLPTTTTTTTTITRNDASRRVGSDDDIEEAVEARRMWPRTRNQSATNGKNKRSRRTRGSGSSNKPRGNTNNLTSSSAQQQRQRQPESSSSRPHNRIHNHNHRHQQQQQQQQQRPRKRLHTHLSVLLPPPASRFEARIPFLKPERLNRIALASEYLVRNTTTTNTTTHPAAEPSEDDMQPENEEAGAGPPIPSKPTSAPAPTQVAHPRTIIIPTFAFPSLGTKYLDEVPTSPSPPGPRSCARMSYMAPPSRCMPAIHNTLPAVLLVGNFMNTPCAATFWALHTRMCTLHAMELLDDLLDLFHTASQPVLHAIAGRSNDKKAEDGAWESRALECVLAWSVLCKAKPAARVLLYVCVHDLLTRVFNARGSGTGLSLAVAGWNPWELIVGAAREVGGVDPWTVVTCVLELWRPSPRAHDETGNATAGVLTPGTALPAATVRVLTDLAFASGDDFPAAESFADMSKRVRGQLNATGTPSSCALPTGPTQAAAAFEWSEFAWDVLFTVSRWNTRSDNWGFVCDSLVALLVGFARRSNEAEWWALAFRERNLRDDTGPDHVVPSKALGLVDYVSLVVGRIVVLQTRWWKSTSSSSSYRHVLGVLWTLTTSTLTDEGTTAAPALESGVADFLAWHFDVAPNVGARMRVANDVLNCVCGGSSSASNTIATSKYQQSPQPLAVLVCAGKLVLLALRGMMGEEEGASSSCNEQAAKMVKRFSSFCGERLAAMSRAALVSVVAPCQALVELLAAFLLALPSSAATLSDVFCEHGMKTTATSPLELLVLVLARMNLELEPAKDANDGAGAGTAQLTVCVLDVLAAHVTRGASPEVGCCCVMASGSAVLGSNVHSKARFPCVSRLIAVFRTCMLPSRDDDHILDNAHEDLFALSFSSPSSCAHEKNGDDDEAAWVAAMEYAANVERALAIRASRFEPVRAELKRRTRVAHCVGGFFRPNQLPKMTMDWLKAGGDALESVAREIVSLAALTAVALSMGDNSDSNGDEAAIVRGLWQHFGSYELWTRSSSGAFEGSAEFFLVPARFVERVLRYSTRLGVPRGIPAEYIPKVVGAFWTTFLLAGGSFSHPDVALFSRTLRDYGLLMQIPVLQELGAEGDSMGHFFSPPREQLVFDTRWIDSLEWSMKVSSANCAEDVERCWMRERALLGRNELVLKRMVSFASQNRLSRLAFSVLCVLVCSPSSAYESNPFWKACAGSMLEQAIPGLTREGDDVVIVGNAERLAGFVLGEERLWGHLSQDERRVLLGRVLTWLPREDAMLRARVEQVLFSSGA